MKEHMHPFLTKSPLFRLEIFGPLWPLPLGTCLPFKLSFGFDFNKSMVIFWTTLVLSSCPNWQWYLQASIKFVKSWKFHNINIGMKTHNQCVFIMYICHLELLFLRGFVNWIFLLPSCLRNQHCTTSRSCSPTMKSRTLSQGICATSHLICFDCPYPIWQISLAQMMSLRLKTHVGGTCIFNKTSCKLGL
jgi:hypothetical protein